MKILQLAKYYPPNWGGIELVTQMVSRAHIDNGDDVDVICFDKLEKKYKGDFNEEVYSIKQDLFLLSTPMSIRFSWDFYSYIKKLAPQIIYVHLPNPYMHKLTWLYHKWLQNIGIKIIAIYHSDLANQKYLGPLYNWFFLETSSFYDKWIVSSDKLAQTSSTLQYISSEKIFIVPFCSSGEQVFHERKIFKGNLLAIGRLVPYKGFEFLVKAMRNLPYNLTIIGDGPLKKKLAQDLPDNVQILGNLSETEKNYFINQSDLLIVSSINRAEAYGMTIVEAFENGLPVLASNIDTGVTFLVQNNITGLVFEIGSVREFSQALKKLASRPHDLQQLSVGCRKMYESLLSYERFKHNLITLL